MNRTKHKFTVVDRIDKNVFQVVPNVIIDYLPYDENHGSIDDKIARINEGIYKGKLIKDPKVMVFDSEEVKDDFRDLIEAYFGTQPNMLIIRYFSDTSVITTDHIRQLFEENRRKYNNP